MALDESSSAWDVAFSTPQRRARQATHANWSGVAFRLEALMLLVFIMISMVIVSGLFVGSFLRGTAAEELLQATTLATGGAENGAEQFSADPTGEAETIGYYASIDGVQTKVDENYEGAYKVARVITATSTESGTLYYATITVERYDRLIYTLDTARYVSDGRS